MGFLYVQRRLDIMRHPFARKLSLRGPAVKVAAEIDAQLSKAHRRIGPVLITAEWLLHETFWKVVPMRRVDVIWVFKAAISPNDPELQMVIRDSLGETIKPLYLTIKGKDKLLKRVSELAPQAIQGYDKQIQELWHSSADKSGFLETVRSRYPTRVSNGVRPS